MAKAFHFDDDDNYDKDDSLQNTKENSPQNIEIEESSDDNGSIQESVVLQENENVWEDETMTKKKKKKKFVWKWWHYVLIAIFALFIAFVAYLFIVMNHDGPVYGSRCEGIQVEISKDHRDSTIGQMKEKYSEIQDLSFEVVCHQLKVDITFKDKMDTKKAQKIAEETVQTLDKLVGQKKEDGHTYSQLFGKINNTSQYEVNVILKSNDSADFPIYGTKHSQRDSFSYTLASVKDKESYEKAQDTLKEEKK
jgi:hypothetical protein